MQVTLTEEAQRLIEQKLKSGRYSTAEEVVFAGLLALLREGRDEFEPGEMQGLLSVANEQIERGETSDGEEFLEEFRQLRLRHQSKAG